MMSSLFCLQVSDTSCDWHHFWSTLGFAHIGLSFNTNLLVFVVACTRFYEACTPILNL
jgi:hypothetical protein